jgi:hypothetical protein
MVYQKATDLKLGLVKSPVYSYSKALNLYRWSEIYAPCPLSNWL